MADPQYHRLTRAKNRSFFGVVSTSRSSLWLGPDHLLQIDTNGYTESYKRFYFRDIQALVLCRTDTWGYWAVLFAALASFFGLLMIFQREAIALGVFGGLASLFVLCLVFDLAAGPTCKAYLRTAVQTEPLVPLNRLRRAQEAFGRLRPLIASAQAPSNQAEIPPEPAETSATGPTPDMPGPNPGRISSARNPPPDNSP
jgi:hypothetical protein